MITYSPVCKTVDELKYVIESDKYDDSIKRDMLVKLRDGDLKEDPADYYDIQAEVESLEDVLHIGSYSHFPRTNFELELSELFAKKIRQIRDSISDQDVVNTFKDYVNANRLFLDIERFGYPKVVMLRGGAEIFAEVNSIEKDDFHVILKSDNMSLRVSHLSDCLKHTHPVFIVKGYNLCYSIYSDFEYSGVQLYWPTV